MNLLGRKHWRKENFDRTPWVAIVAMIGMAIASACACATTILHPRGR